MKTIPRYLQGENYRKYLLILEIQEKARTLTEAGYGKIKFACNENLNYYERSES